MRIININGVFYTPKENEHGVYMERVNEDGSPWVDTKPQYTKEEIKAGISIGPAPAKIEVVKKRKPWYKRIFG